MYAIRSLKNNFNELKKKTYKNEIVIHSFDTKIKHNL